MSVHLYVTLQPNGSLSSVAMNIKMKKNEDKNHNLWPKGNFILETVQYRATAPCPILLVSVTWVALQGINPEDLKPSGQECTQCGPGNYRVGLIFPGQMMAWKNHKPGFSFI